MRYYQELTLVPDTSVSIYDLWGEVYRHLHFSLVDLFPNEKSEVGVSFPEYKNDGEDRSLGLKMRVFADNECVLEMLNLNRKLRNYQDYIHLTQFRPVPKDVQKYAVYRRFHPEATQARKARRYAKRHNISYEEALQLFPPDTWRPAPPFVEMTSLSTGRDFRLHIEKLDAEKSCDEGFSSYGLDNASAVPEF